MAKEYEINIFDVDSLKMAEKILSNFTDNLKNEQFMIFLADKCMVELNNIIDKTLNTDEYTTEYRDNNKYQTSIDEIIISNDSMVDLSNVSAKTLENYPNGLSLSKLIEFGTGILGTPNDEFDWQTEVNPNRDYSKGWVYERDGKLYWTKGQQGHFIYNQLRESILQNIDGWVKQYIETKME